MGKSSHTTGSTAICALGTHILVLNTALANEYKESHNRSILISAMDVETGSGW